MELFHVEPPSADASPEAWEAWLEADKKAATVAKRSNTISLEYGDIDDALGHISMGFEGDFSEGTGEIVAVVQATQDVEPRRERKRGSKRKRPGKRKRAKQRKGFMRC